MEIVKAFNNLVDIVKGAGNGIKKFVKKRKVNNINTAIDNHDVKRVNDVMYDIEKKREARKDQ